MAMPVTIPLSFPLSLTLPAAAAPAQRAEFEVASVKPNHSDNNLVFINPRGLRFGSPAGVRRRET